MSYIENLRNEIDCYLDDLLKYKSSNYEQTWKIVDEASRREIEFYEGTLFPLNNEAAIVSEALDQIVEYDKLADYIRGLVKEDAIRRNYEKLLRIRKVVSKAFPTGISYEIFRKSKAEVGTELLKKRQEIVSKQKEALSDWQKYDYLELSHYMNESDLSVVSELRAALIPIALCTTLKFDKYTNLLQVLILFALGSDCAKYYPKFEDNYSVVFREKFSDLCFALTRSNSDGVFRKEIFETLSYEYGINSGGSFASFYFDYEKRQGLVIIKEDFLRNLLDIIDGNDYFDLFDVIDSLYAYYGKPNITESYQIRIKELRRLYRETPDQILVTEQRYYQEQQIDQIRENASLERMAIEEQFQQDRRERAYQERLNRQQMKEQAELDRKERAYQEEKNRKQLEANRRSVEQENIKKRNEQMTLCRKCANWFNGCHGGIYACGNFRPKK